MTVSGIGGVTVIVCGTGGTDMHGPLAAAMIVRHAGDRARLSVVEGEGHFEFLDPESQCWELSMRAVLEARRA